MAQRSKFQCPHCAASMTIRSSREAHPLLRQLWFQCSNYLCGFTCGGNLEITHQISPSACPRPGIQLKTHDEITAQRKAANDEHQAQV